MAANPQGCRPAVYARRRPEQTVLHRLVQQHLETYLALAWESDGDGHAVPGYAELELRRDLECGILAYGFARARGPACGHDFLVAFSCKGRGICPSCNARRMAETAAHLVDHVFPPLPVRQWVLSVPKRLRWYLEREPKAVTAVLHIFLRVVEAHLRKHSPGASARARFRAVSFIHRFGASLNRHIHYHCCILDGVFDLIEEGAVQFRQASALHRRPRPGRTGAAASLLCTPTVRPCAHRTGQRRPDRLSSAGATARRTHCAPPSLAAPSLVPDKAFARLEGPLELRVGLTHLVALIPPPRLHRHRYHGVLAPNAPLRLAATA